MTHQIETMAITPRSVVACIAPKSHHYWLDQPCAWHLQRQTDHKIIAEGVAEAVPLFLDGLQPSTAYKLETPFGHCIFTTADCAGLVDITQFGADPTLSDNSDAISDAISSLPEGGTLYVPEGRFVTRPLFLKGNMVLHLAEGAVLAAPASRKDWPILPARNASGEILGTWEGLAEPSFAALLTAINSDGLAITGRGVIDGGGDRGDWWQWPKETRQNARRPRSVFLSRCSRVTLSGVTIRNSPSWTVHPHLCRELTAASVTIENPADSPNTDGFNPESCEDTRIIGLRISVGDDCIAVKSGKRGDGSRSDDHLAPTRRMQIENCLFEKGHGAVVLGSEMSGDITDVDIARCIFIGTDRGLRIKTRRGRGGSVTRITMSDVIMQDVLTPFVVNAFYFCDADGRSQEVQSREPAAITQRTPSIGTISLRNITAHNAHIAGAAVLGLPEAPVTGVSFENFQISFHPDAQADHPVMACDVPSMRHMPVFEQFAQIDGAIDLIVDHKEPSQC